MDPTNWLAWWPIIVPVAVGAFAFLRWALGVYTERKKTVLDKSSTDADRVFARTEALIDQQQQILEAQRAEIIEVKQQCVVDLANLRARADEVERRLLEKVGVLERQVDNLQVQLELRKNL